MWLTNIFNLFSAKAESGRNFCPVCDEVGVSFSPLPNMYFEGATRHGFRHFGKGEMTSLETYSCKNCGASDRERLYAYWIQKQIHSKNLVLGARLIHFAPEPALANKLKNLKHFEYTSADYSMSAVDHQVDIMNLPFESRSFDFFICSHVLEHVEKDNVAISELFRIIKPNGCGILVAPIVTGLEQTIEDPAITDEAERWKLFGQNDHVRLYAHDDYVSRITNAGFEVEQFGEQHFGRQIFHSLGLKRSSILYIVTRP